MIIVRSPLRISLGGGGTDLPSYYREHEGFLIAAAINKYIYINITKPFIEGIVVTGNPLATLLLKNSRSSMVKPKPGTPQYPKSYRVYTAR